jgi:subtilisin family serine protease
MKLQVVVNKLNRRKSPITDFANKSNIADVVNRGFEFESVAQIENTLGMWYQDRDGLWAWGKGLSSGVEAAPQELAETQVEFDSTKMSWGHQQYEIPSIWKELNTKGEGITVAVIDTGIDIHHPDLAPNIHESSKSFIGDEKDFSDGDGHGTQMAGIIAATGSSKAYGVSPGSKLLVVKASQSGDQDDLKHFIEAIDYVSGISEVSVVSISYGFTCPNFDDDCKSLVTLFGQSIDKCLAAGKIIVAAIGDNHFPGEIDKDTYPSAFNANLPFSKGVLGVGAFDKQGSLCDFSRWNSHLCFLSPGDSIWTTTLNSSGGPGEQTSIATAFTSGCIALILSYMKQSNQISTANCIDAILSTCDQMDGVDFNTKNGYGKMNLKNAIAKIKTH